MLRTAHRNVSRVSHPATNVVRDRAPAVLGWGTVLIGFRNEGLSYAAGTGCNRRARRGRHRR